MSFERSFPSGAGSIVDARPVSGSANGIVDDGQNRFLTRANPTVLEALLDANTILYVQSSTNRTQLIKDHRLAVFLLSFLP